MNKKLMEVMTNPIKCKLLFEINSCKQTTAKHLAEKFSDIPQATLYRYLKKMTADGILKIVEETQVRGAVERTYSVAINLSKEGAKIISNNSGEAYMQAFTQYVLGFIKLFQEYCNSDNINIQEDKSGFSLAPIYLTDEELEKVVTSIHETIKPHRDNEPAENRKLRSIGVIVSPPTKK
ncbi:hypothetical protein ACWG0P_04745 [Amedibacillus sp. YH-ame6]